MKEDVLLSYAIATLTDQINICDGKEERMEGSATGRKLSSRKEDSWGDQERKNIYEKTSKLLINYSYSNKANCSQLGRKEEAKPEGEVESS